MTATLKNSPVANKPSGKLTFTVDSALLRELGERLVGKAHIALAELIKNSYDADATVCKISFADDSIEIVDNGKGMDLKDFKNYWMRVGTTHKQREQYSELYARPLTGSKGVGRLSVQFLAESVQIQSTPRGGRSSIAVRVNWNDTIKHEFLTQATANYSIQRRIQSYAQNAPHGFRIKLTGLMQDWQPKSLASLAKEIWTLRPPFDGYAGKAKIDRSKDFRIELESDDSEGQAAFESQLAAIENLWIAKIEGAIESGYLSNGQRVTITFKDGESVTRTFAIPNCRIDSASWEIRIFNLSGHLGSNVKVQDAREYFAEFGGVHVYDGPFRLPYYGIQQDWLGIEFDHSHRKVKSRLLPSELHVDRALNDLPSQGRILGVVRVDTGDEMRAARRFQHKSEYLKIQVTRDRLQINQAYEQLRVAVRRSIDFYAVCSMSKRLKSSVLSAPSESATEAASRVESALNSYRREIPPKAFDSLKSEITSFVASSRKEQSYKDSIVSLLGPLASAGMAALALEHETTRQLALLRAISAKMQKSSNIPAIKDASFAINEWVDNFKQLRRVFEPLSSAEDREDVRSMSARKVLQLIRNSMKPFLANIVIKEDFNEEVFLPRATLAEWQGVFQNVITNSLNAMIDAPRKTILISSGVTSGRRAWVRLSDTGIGVDLIHANKYFEPFSRFGEISDRRRSLGLGGHGLGLTIVRMIAENRNCKVQFIEPLHQYKTTFEISWSVQNG